MHLPHSKVKKYFIEHMGADEYTLDQMFKMYMELMNCEGIFRVYTPIKESSMDSYLRQWTREKNGFLSRKGRGDKALYSKRVESLSSPKSYLDGLSFCEPRKFSEVYDKVNKVLCALLRKEHRDDSSQH